MSSLTILASESGLLDLALKSAAVMLLALAAVALLGRSSAARRHLVWCLSVSSLLLLPVLSWGLPAWRATWLPQWTAEPVLVAATGQTTVTQEVGPHDAPPMSTDLSRSATVTTTAAADVARAAVIEPVRPARGPFPWMALGWFVGVMVSLMPLAVGLWQLAAVQRRSQAIDDQHWREVLDALRRELGLRRTVELRQSDTALAPLTWGALRPVLLIPAEAHAWPEERRRLVLLHELAHVCRWDWLTQLVAHVACALYWFNPLVWLAARQMRIERERACDDLVLASGARASDYAQELLAVAAGLSHSQLSTLVAVPMARRGVLEDRLRGILDSRRSRAALTTAAVCVGLAVATVAIAPLAMLRAAPPESKQPETEKPKEEPPVKEKRAAEKLADADKPQKDPLLGKDAAERVKKFRPSFSKAQAGVEVGISLASDRKAFRAGERLPLELVIRNVSGKPLLVKHGLYPPHNPPTVYGSDGKQIPIKVILLSGAIRGYQHILQPNEVAVYRHMGLGLGEEPEPPGTFWYPFLANAVPGKYRLSQEVHLTVSEEGQDAGGTSFHAASGEVEFEIKLADSTKGDAAPAEKPADTPAEKPASRPLTIRGKVVDSATGKPVSPFITQSGKFVPANEKQVLWGVREEPSSDGSFSTTVHWAEGSTARILAEGYLPQPLLTAAPPAGKDELEVTIRLARIPETVRGVVLDHAGKPVQDAAVFAMGTGGLNVVGGQARITVIDDPRIDRDAHPVQTDEQGRFELPTGGVRSLVVSHAAFDAWQTAMPASGEITIRLPEPARVEVSLDIDGADEECPIFFQLIMPYDPAFGYLQSARYVSTANPGKLTVTTLPPGKYQFWRGPVGMLDRELFELKSGETKRLAYVRPTGARVRGKVTWPADAKLEGIFVSVIGETKYAALSPAADGTFLTERIPPGTHELVAHAYEPQANPKMIGLIVPTYNAKMRIDVPAKGELNVPDLALKKIAPGK